MPSIPNGCGRLNLSQVFRAIYGIPETRYGHRHHQYLQIVHVSRYTAHDGGESVRNALLSSSDVPVDIPTSALIMVS